jgi:hypothetical protein
MRMTEMRAIGLSGELVKQRIVRDANTGVEFKVDFNVKTKGARIERMTRMARILPGPSGNHIQEA